MRKLLKRAVDRVVGQYDNSVFLWKLHGTDHRREGHNQHARS